MSIAYEYDDLETLIAAHKRHLLVLRTQQATLGAQTPAHILTSIEDYEAEIKRLTGELPELTTREKHLLDLQFQMRIEGDLYKLDRKVDQIAALLDTLLLDLARRGLAAPPRKLTRARRINGE